MRALSYENLTDLDSGKPTKVLFFWATWCANCRTQDPIIAVIEQNRADSIDFYSVKADDNQDLLRKYKVLGVPTIIMIRHGFVVMKKTGVQSLQKLNSQLDTVTAYTETEARTNEHKGLLRRLFSSH